METATEGMETKPVEPVKEEEVKEVKKEAKKEKEKPMKKESENFVVALSDIIVPKDIEWNRDGTRGASELVTSLKEVGQIVAISVRKRDDKYEIVDGRRRYMAMKEAGIKNAFVTFAEGDDKETRRKAVVANLNRKAHDPIELSNIFNELLENGFTNREIARACGVSDAFVSQHVALKNLSGVLQTEVKKGHLLPTQCRELLRIDQEKYSEGFEKIAAKALAGMDAAQLKDTVTLFLEKKKSQEEKKDEAAGKKKEKKSDDKEVKKGRPIKVREYDSAAIKVINKASLLSMLEAVEAQRAKSQSALRQKYLAGMRDGLEMAGGLRDIE